MQSQNGQSPSEQEQPKRKGRFTGQRLKLLRPEIYRQAVENNCQKASELFTVVFYGLKMF
jgi:hypothetical protein